MPMFRKKPVVIEAFCLGKDNMPDWFCDARTANNVITHNVDGRWRGGPDYAEIKTLEGTMRADFGDWIIKGVKGELYPCKPDIFDATYEPVAPTSQPPQAQSGDDVGDLQNEIAGICIDAWQSERLSPYEMCDVFLAWLEKTGRVNPSITPPPNVWEPAEKYIRQIYDLISQAESARHKDLSDTQCGVVPSPNYYIAKVLCSHVANVETAARAEERMRWIEAESTRIESDAELARSSIKLLEKVAADLPENAQSAWGLHEVILRLRIDEAASGARETLNQLMTDSRASSREGWVTSDIPCDNCDRNIPAAEVEAAKHEAPSYMPDRFHRRIGTMYFCEHCREAMFEHQQERS